jgi:SAM-dependent methyltransferase
MSSNQTATNQAIKACRAGAYASDWARFLIGDSMHPGREGLTERLGDLLQLGPGSRVLDVAAGRGISAVALARRFGCRVVGIDLSPANVLAARKQPAHTGLAQSTSFEVADAEALPFAAGEFDAVICECAFCTFPDKPRAASGMARVTKPGGRLGLSDLVRRGELPGELQTLAGWVACIADARPEAEYVQVLVTPVFVNPHSRFTTTRSSDWSTTYGAACWARTCSPGWASSTWRELTWVKPGPSPRPRIPPPGRAFSATSCWRQSRAETIPKPARRRRSQA